MSIEERIADILGYERDFFFSEGKRIDAECNIIPPFLSILGISDTDVFLSCLERIEAWKLADNELS